MNGRSILLLLLAAAVVTAAPSSLKLATTTSTDNSGLLGVLLPAFTKKTGITVHVIAVGSGKAIKLGENGDVDVLLVHSRKAEEQFVVAGFGVDRRDVMYNDFVIVGPPGDPAGINGQKDAAAALKKIAAAGATFVSRGDESGTHVKEKELWPATGVTPGGPWYLEAGQGMEAVLMMASEKQAYTLTDRGTFIAVRDKLRLAVLCEGDTVLFNQYGVIAVNPAKYAHVKSAAARMFVEWITASEGQGMIAGFRKNGGQLFFPNFVKKEAVGNE
ncbi:MAG: substrate-binding domain-containing protein [Chitinispirillaceae bacterium]|nr:substrate-binding domain-containing protein [Chitinispirillaceae bacterium]